MHLLPDGEQKWHIALVVALLRAFGPPLVAALVALLVGLGILEREVEEAVRRALFGS